MFRNQKELGELSQDWVEKGIITHEQRLGILEATPKTNSETLVAQVVTSLSVILVGLGIIFLVAFNWAQIPKLIKITLSFLPLLGSLAYCLYALKAKEVLHKEASALFNGVSLLIAIIIPGQIYHLEGSYGQMVTLAVGFWIPTLLLFRSTGATLVAMVLLGSALGDFFDRGLWIPALMFLTGPAVFLLKRGFQEKHSPTLLWIPALGILGTMILALFREPESGPLLILGILSAISILSSLEPWIRGVGQMRTEEAPIYRDSLKILSIILLVPGFFLLATNWFWEIERLPLLDFFTRWPWSLYLMLPLIASGLGMQRQIITGRWSPFAHVGSFYLVMNLISSLMINVKDAHWILVILVSLAGLLQGFFWIVGHKSSSTQILGGSALVAAIINLRFFDSEIPLLIKSLVFILSGILLFLVFHSRKKLGGRNHATP